MLLERIGVANAGKIRFLVKELTEEARGAFRVAIGLAVLVLVLRLLWAGFVATTIESEGLIMHA